MLKDKSTEPLIALDRFSIGFLGLIIWNGAFEGSAIGLDGREKRQ